MLNRRLSEYLFYGTLAGIALGIFLLRLLIIGNLNDRIDTLKHSNASFQSQIDALEDLVQENKNVQTSHLYELYDIIPNVFSATSLTYKTVAILEELGIDESDTYNRTVFVDTNINIENAPQFADLAKDYYIVRVEVTFNTDDVSLVTDFIDEIYASEQLFIIDSVEYVDTSGDYSMEMIIHFLAVYDVEITEES